MKTVSLVGWNGARNIGDDMMTSVLIEQLVLKEYKRFYIPIIGSKLNFEFLNKFESRGDLTFIFIELDDRNRYSKYFRLFSYLFWLPTYLLIKSDLIIVGGGSLFYGSIINFMILQICFLRDNISSFKKKGIELKGVTIGPFSSSFSKRICLMFLKRIDHIIVRDRKSFEFVKAHIHSDKIFHYPDLALSFERVGTYKNVFDNYKDFELVPIVIRQGELNTEMKDAILKMILRFNELSDNYLFVLTGACRLEASSEDDQIAINDLLEMFKVNSVNNFITYLYNGNIEEFLDLISISKFTICVRLHAAIISYLCKVPFFMFSYNPKCINFFTDMNLSKDFIIDTKDIAMNLNMIDEACNLLNNLEHNFYFKPNKRLFIF